MSRSTSLSLLGLSIALCSSATFADTVWLKNGDRLSGTIRFFDGSKLLLETDYGGSIPLDWKKIATLESDHELLVKLGPVDGERAKSLLAAEPGKVTLANGESPKTIELSQIEQIMKPKPLVEDFTWKGNIDLGLDYKRGERDSDDYDVDIKTQARHGLWRHNALADYNRELKDDVVSTDNWSAEYALDRFLTEKWFWQGASSTSATVSKRWSVSALSVPARVTSSGMTSWVRSPLLPWPTAAITATAMASRIASTP